MRTWVRSDVAGEEHGANADRITLSRYAGIHLDGPRHFFLREGSPRAGDIPLGGGRLAGGEVIVDIAEFVENCGMYGKKEILQSGADVREGTRPLFPAG
jgi:hypothetical protein